MSSVAKLFQQRLFIYVKYDPQILENLLPKVHFFTGVVNLNADKLKREIKSVNFLEQVEPPGYVWNGESIDFDNGGFQREKILCEDDQLADYAPGESILEKNPVCRHCANNGQSYFCDVTDRQCENMVKFKNRVLNSDIRTTKCEVKSLKNSEEFKLGNNIVWPYFTGTSTKEYKLWLLSRYPF